LSTIALNTKNDLESSANDYNTLLLSIQGQISSFSAITDMLDKTQSKVC